ncbi:hypothetical protein JCM10296v2_005904 [Rhodotorula toruloides]
MLSRAVHSQNALKSTRSSIPIFLPSLPTRTRPAAQLLFARRYATPPADPSVDPSFPHDHQQPLREPKPRNATSEFYRDLIPSMLHCLALGSIVYYGLETGYMYLSREKQAEDLGKRVEELERELAVVRAGPAVIGSDGEKSIVKSWWKFW